MFSLRWLIKLEGQYFSPYIHALRDSNLSTETYTGAIPALVERLTGYFGGPLSEFECLAGVPGSVNSINLRTSMGPPIYRPKSEHINSTRTEISPDLASMIDEIESALSRREVPTILAEAVLKDEVLKKGKNARVFCMVSAAFNIVCKSRFAILKKALRYSYFQSGCAVGLDMGSRKVEDLTDFLRGSKYLYAMDVSRFDKCWTPQAWDAVAQVISQVVGYSAGEQVGWESYALVMAMKEAIICIKGDLFTSFWNIMTRK